MVVGFQKTEDARCSPPGKGLCPGLEQPHFCMVCWSKQSQDLHSEGHGDTPPLHGAEEHVKCSYDHLWKIKYAVIGTWTMHSLDNY